jgi:2-dehydro-3-deoxyphosphogluconate aldolase/(4S)-4-hydroxy-2-oxoglutarate aldolase
MTRDETRRQIDEIGIVPCAHVTSPECALFAAEALHSSGIPVIEITLAFPEAPDVIENLARRFPDMAVGAGLVQDEDSARRCVNAGARFLTSLGFVPEVVAYAAKADVVVFPGALTPTEIISAWKAGADFVKIFPTDTVGGAHYVRALTVPMPQIPLIVTGGVNQLTAHDYILAGASAVGVDGELLPKEALHQRRDRHIRELARRFLSKVKDARALLMHRSISAQRSCAPNDDFALHGNLSR